MRTVRRWSWVAFVVACTHLVFGAIVRISGSGMGCGNNWPKCEGAWFPPFDRPDLIVEVTHRYLASILLLTLTGLFVVAWKHREERGVGGRGGVLRGSGLALALAFGAALLGALTVKFGNAPFATLAHWTVAMSLVATVVATVIRAGGLGGTAARDGGASAKTKRAAFVAAVMALLAVVMGGLTAKYPGASVACQSFPLCGTNPDVATAAVHIQLTHRIIAVLLILHLFGMVMALRKRREAPVVRRAAAIAFSLGILQLLVAGAMIGMHLPPVLRSLHEATGVSVWIATFAFAYLARIASGGSALGVTARRLPPDDEPDAGAIRVAAPKQVFAGAIATRDEEVDVEAREPWQSEEAESLVFENQFVVDEPLTVVEPTGFAPIVTEVPMPLGEPVVAEQQATVEVSAVEASMPVDAPTAIEAPVAATEAVGTSAIEVAQPVRVEVKSTMNHSVAVIVARGADL